MAAQDIITRRGGKWGLAGAPHARRPGTASVRQDGTPAAFEGAQRLLRWDNLMKTMILVALAVAQHASIPPRQSPGRRKSVQPGVPRPDPLSRAVRHAGPGSSGIRLEGGVNVASVSASPAILSSLVHRPMGTLEARSQRPHRTQVPLPLSTITRRQFLRDLRAYRLARLDQRRQIPARPADSGSRPATGKTPRPLRRA